MVRHLGIFLWIVGLSSGVSAQTKVLFLGNSYTGVNNLPSLVSQVSASLGDTITYDSNTPGGYTLQGHATNATSQAKIKADDWDFVVMQEQSQRLSFDDGYTNTNVMPYAEQLVDSIKANNACTQPVFYMTWGRKYGDQQNCATYPWSCTFDSMTYRIRHNYHNVANQTDATLAPVGISWQHSWHNDNTIDLWTADNSHPSIHGSYLAACTFYATLFKKSPDGAWYPNGISAAEASYLQQVAVASVLQPDSVEQWNLCYQPTADFGFYFDASNQLILENFSTNSGAWEWTFGGGNTSTDFEPVYSTAFTDSLEVCLVASDSCFADTFCQWVPAMALGFTEHKPHVYEVFPNPSHDIFTIQPKSNEGYQWNVFDLSGRLVKESKLQVAGLERVDLSNLMPGGYVLKIKGSSVISMVILKH